MEGRIEIQASVNKSRHLFFLIIVLSLLLPMVILAKKCRRRRPSRTNTMTSNKSVLITGCSDGGIGSALAIVLQQAGYRVFATARNPEKMQNLKDLSNLTLLTLDVTDSTHISAAVETVSRETDGNLTYLINNAGRNHFMPILDEDIDAAKKIYETNVWGPVAITKAFAPLLIKAKGTIVFTTSISGYVNVPYMGVYGASKRSIEIIAETLRLEMAPFHVNVLSVVTGAVKTNGQTYFQDWKLPEDSLYKPIEDTIHKRTQGEDGVKRMELMEYATKVVHEIVGGHTGKLWYGNNAGSVKFGSTYLPSSMMDSGVVKGTGLDVLAKQRL